MTVAAITAMGVPLLGVEVGDGPVLAGELGVLVDDVGLLVEDGELLLMQDVSLEAETVLKSELPPCRARESTITKITVVPL